MRKQHLVCLLMVALTGNVFALSASPQTQYRLALTYKKQGQYEQAVPIMQRLATQGHIEAKTSLASMLLPIHYGRGQFVKMPYTDENAALDLLREAVAQGYGPAMVLYADWLAERAVYRCQGPGCQTQNLKNAKALHEQGARAGQHQSYAWLSYFYKTFCGTSEAKRVLQLKHQAMKAFMHNKQKPRPSQAGGWYEVYGVISGYLTRIPQSAGNGLCSL